MSSITGAISTAGRTRTSNKLHRRGDRLADVLSRGLASDVAGARAFGEDALDRAHDGLARVLVAEVLEHHRAGPDLSDGIGDVLAGDVGRRAVDRLEHRGELALGIDVARGRDR